MSLFCNRCLNPLPFCDCPKLDSLFDVPLRDLLRAVADFPTDSTEEISFAE
jgi:hypothetical protein